MQPGGFVQVERPMQRDHRSARALLLSNLECHRGGTATILRTSRRTEHARRSDPVRAQLVARSGRSVLKGPRAIRRRTRHHRSRDASRSICTWEANMTAPGDQTSDSAAARARSRGASSVRERVDREASARVRDASS